MNALKVVDLLYIYPNGINTKSTEIEGLVESSTNLGIVSQKIMLLNLIQQLEAQFHH